MPKTTMRTPRSNPRTRCLVCAYDRCIKCSNVTMYAHFSALKLKIYTRLQIKHACRIHSSDYITLSDLYMRWVLKQVTSTCEQTYGPRREKTNILHMRKQRRRSADQRLCFRYIDTTIPLISKSDISSL